VTPGLTISPERVVLETSLTIVTGPAIPPASGRAHWSGQGSTFLLASQRMIRWIIFACTTRMLRNFSHPRGCPTIHLPKSRTNPAAIRIAAACSRSGEAEY
jgi:hypothetical protein